MANPFHSICICLFTYCTGITLVNSPISSYYCIHPIHVCIHPQLLLLVTVMYCTVVTAEPEHGASARQTNSSLACIVLMDIISYDPGHMVCSGLTWLFLESQSLSFGKECPLGIFLRQSTATSPGSFFLSFASH
ncbi:uncharacterized protein B0J16DRAFT_6893 [Fusarium flagelliforme]|uniref:uncharacterized protein n=1 Tax=Fusarium flagelliforme TaxID=2675880 RepID=UPI001E8DC181|nr:uncharacterized protein B0J16DRAFT_6893 [Fusarium flagelliforme]KAH7196829.1 hypothetical protein B0J16DRAFT_6893 [Fusarium flagelliforme]